LLRCSLLAATLALLTVGCGRGGPLHPLDSRPLSVVSVLADLPAIDSQIKRATIALDETGTRVSRMPDPGRAKAVTFLSYKALDNNLGITRAQHINVLERSGSNTGINVLAITDEPGPNNTYGYYVRQDKNAERVTSPYMPIWPGERNMGSPLTLAQSVRWGFSAYPAQLRWLDINNHGYGAFGIADDERSKSRIELSALAAALKVGNQKEPLDLVSFDACLMSTLEVAYELRDAARYVVASEDASYAVGMNYDKTIKSLEGKPTTADKLARALVLRAERKGSQRAIYSLSALDMSRAAQSAKAVDQLAGALLKALPQHREAIRRAIAQTPRFYLSGDDKTGVLDQNHQDLSALADSIRGVVPDENVRRACIAVKDSLFGRGGLVAMTFNAPEQQQAAQGVSIHVSVDTKPNAIYRRTSFARDTRWDEFLLAL